MAGANPSGRRASPDPRRSAASPTPRAGPVIVACGLTNNAADQAEIRPLLDAIAAGLGGSPEEVSADVGYCSEVNLETLAARGIRCGRVTVQDPGAQSFRSCQRVE